MIRLNRLNNSEIVINVDLIEMMEETPDLVITLSTGKKIVVSQKMDEVIELIIKFKSRIINFRPEIEHEGIGVGLQQGEQ
jgi:flagellar protein FlbD